MSDTQRIIDSYYRDLEEPAPDFEIGDLVLVSGEYDYEAIIISWNDDGTATVQSEATGNKYNVDPEIMERPTTARGLGGHAIRVTAVSPEAAPDDY
jgi:hypothetical protein